MSQRDPSWSDAHAASLRASGNWWSPDGTFNLNWDEGFILERGAIIRGVIGPDEGFDVLRVWLTTGNAYYFSAAQTWRAPIVEVFDWEGYRLRATNQDDVGTEGAHNADTLIDFRPSYTGWHYMRVVGTGGLPTDYAAGVYEDLFADGRDTGRIARLTIEQPEVSHVEGRSGTTAFTYTLVRSGDLESWHAVSWYVTGSGARGADAWDFPGLTIPGGYVSFAPGETHRAITVEVNGDLEREGEEGFTLRLHTPSPGLSLTRSTATGRILDDEPVIWLEATDNSVRSEGNSGTTAFTFMARRAGDGSAADSVAWWIWNDANTPTNGADYAGGMAPWGRVTFAPGEYFKEITVHVAGDSLGEGDEAFSIHIGDASPGVQVTTNSAVGRILNDDVTFAVTGTSAAAREGGTTPLTFTVTRGGPTDGAASVGWTVVGSGPKAAGAADFGGTLPSGRVDFAPGQTSRTITVNIASDGKREGAEGFAILLGTPSAGATVVNGRAEGQILADPVAASFKTDTVSKAEGGTGVTTLQFSLSFSGPLEADGTLDWAVTGRGASAANAADFVAGVLPKGTLVLARGATSGLITVAVAGDLLPEATEEFTLTLSNPSPGIDIVEPTARGRILADDTAISIAAVATAMSEGQAGTTDFDFVVTRSGRIGRAETISWSVSGDGPAKATSHDFVGGKLPSGTVSFAAGETQKTITVGVKGDRTLEADEGFAVTLSKPATGTVLTTPRATAVILTDDNRISIAADQAAKAEGASGATPFTFTVTRTGDLTRAEGVSWRVEGNGSKPAKASDFTSGVLPFGQVEFAAGEREKVITVNVAGDAAPEASEGFRVVLSGAAPGSVIGTSRATATITDDDSFGLSVSLPDATIAEGWWGAFFRISIETPRNEDTSVAWRVVGHGAAPVTMDDFGSGVLVSGRAVIEAGQRFVDVPFDQWLDPHAEPDEGFQVVISDPSAGYIKTSSATGMIIDDDTFFRAIPEPASGAEGQSGVTQFALRIQREGWFGRADTVRWVLEGDGADPVEAADFSGGVLPSGELTFAAGEAEKTIFLPVLGDAVAEGSEGFRIRILDPASGAARDQFHFSSDQQPATITVVDDDTAGRVSIVAQSGMLNEGDGGLTIFTFKAFRTGDLTKAASVDWAVTVPIGVDINQVDFEDYELPEGRLTFAPGQAEAIIEVPVIADTAVERLETFTVSLTHPSAGLQLGAAATQATIRDDDIYIHALRRGGNTDGDRIAEGSGESVFWMTIYGRGLQPLEPLSVEWRVEGVGSDPAKAEDFLGGVFPSGMVVFGPGHMGDVQVAIPIAADALVETLEGFRVVLTGPVGVDVYNSHTYLIDDVIL